MSTNFETSAVEQLPQPVDMAEPSRLHELLETGKRIAGRTVLVIGLTTGLVAGELVVDEASTVAVADGYPDSGKPCVAVGDPQYGQTQGTGYWCNNYEWGDSPSQQNSSRGYGYRNCTDWTAYRIPQLTGITVPRGWHQANNWDAAAAAAGYTVDNTPEPGDAAVWDAGDYGHVEVVESVNSNGTVNTSGYNKHRDGNPDTQSGVIADHYIDFNGTGKGIGGASLNGSETIVLNSYGPKAVTVTPNVLGGISVFTAADSGLMAYKDQAYAGQDLATKPWGTITEHTIGQPEVVTTPSGALAVFAHGANDHLYHAWQTAAGSTWSGDISPWNVSLRGDPAATFNYTGGMSVFFPDSNGNMREIDQIGSGGDMGSAPVHNLGGNLQGKPAVMNIDNKVVLFAHGADGGLYTDYQSAVGGTWSGWELLGGQDIQGDPVTIINRLGGMTVMAVSESGDLVGIDQTYKGESMNKPFYSLGKPSGVNLAGTPALLQTTNGEQMVFAESTDGAVYHKAQVQSNSYGWSGYYPLGGDLTSKPTVIRNSAGGASIFGRAENGDVVTLDQPGYGASFNTNWIDLGKG